MLFIVASITAGIDDIDIDIDTDDADTDDADTDDADLTMLRRMVIVIPTLYTNLIYVYDKM